MGNGQSTVLHGFAPPPARYKVYLAEIAGEALAFNLLLRDSGGRIIGEKQWIIDPHEQTMLEVSSLFPHVVAKWPLVVLEGTNGSGKIVAVGVELGADGAEGTAYAMSMPLRPRLRIPWPEAATYIAVTLAVIVAAFVRR